MGEGRKGQTGSVKSVTLKGNFRRSRDIFRRQATVLEFHRGEEFHSSPIEWRQKKFLLVKNIKQEPNKTVTNVSGCCFSVAFISAAEQQEMYLNNNYSIDKNLRLSKAMRACFAANALKHNGVNLLNRVRITGRRHQHLLG